MSFVPADYWPPGPPTGGAATDQTARDAAAAAQATALAAVSTGAELAPLLADPTSAYALPGVPGSQPRSEGERGQDRLSALEFMTRAQQADVKAGTALSNLGAALDVRAALQAGIDYCQPKGIELVLPSYPMRIDADPAPPTPTQKGLRCITSGTEVPGLRIAGGGPLASRLVPTFTNGVVLEIDGSAPIYSFQRTGWLRQFSIYPPASAAGVVGVRWVGCLHFEISHVHIQGLGSHAMWFPWRGDKGGNTYLTNPDGWSSGSFSFQHCRFYRNGGWAILQESGIGGYTFLFDNFYFMENRQGGMFLSGAGHELRKGVLASNGWENDLYGWGMVVARRMGQGAGIIVQGPVELDSNWAGNIWAQAPNGMRIEGVRNNSWSTIFPAIGVPDTQLRPPVHIRLGGSVAGAVAQRIDMLRCAHRSQNVAAGASAEKHVTWYQAHDATTFVGGQIQNPFNDSQSANAQKYSQGGGAMFTATISGGAVTGFVRKSGGLGYSAAAPTVIISGGGGTGATGTAVVDGQVTELVPTDPGLGYVPGAVLPVTLTGGGGTGATGTCLVDEWGQAWTFTVTNPGTGYTSAPTATLPAPPAGATIRQATCQAAWSRVVGSITLGAPGAAYASAPDVILVPADLRATSLVNFKLDILEFNQVVGTCGQAPACRYRSTAGTVSVAGTGTTPTVIKYETVIGDNAAIYNTGTGQVTIPYTGLGKVAAKFGLPGILADEVVEFGVYENGTVRDIKRVKARGIATAIGAGAGSETFDFLGSYFFTKGATVDVRALTSHGSALPISAIAAENAFEFEMVR